MNTPKPVAGPNSGPITIQPSVSGSAVHPTKPVVAGGGAAGGKPTLSPNQQQVRASAASPPRPIAREAQAIQQPKVADDTSVIWKAFFNQWPEGIPTRGIVVTQLNEQLPFKGYMVKGDVVLLERTNPDTLGSRYILVPYSEVGIVKLTDPLNQEKFEKAGFQGELCG